MRLEWALKATVRNLEFILVVISSSDWTLSQGVREPDLSL